MFIVSTAFNPTTHTITAINAEFASVILETALRHELYCEADESDERRIIIFYIQEEQLDEILREARDEHDNACLMKMAA